MTKQAQQQHSGTALTHGEHCLNVRHLVCVRQQRPLFAPISFTLNAQGILFIQGNNGAGKSSLLRLLTGLATPQQGDILWDQQTITTLHSDYSKQLHYLGHENGLKAGLSVLENLTLACHLQEASTDALATTLNALLLTPQQNMPVKQLSSGQQRRVALARLLLVKKPLWILDEPMTALDHVAQQLFLDHLAAHLQYGGICIMTSHQTLTHTFNAAQTLRLSAC